MKPRLLFYCQHLLGIGHLTRSLAICRELVHEFEVFFIQGGPDVGKSITHTDFHLHRLTPIMMEESTSALYDPVGDLKPDQLLEKRQQELRNLTNKFHFDVIITELFPFGRGKLKKEILSLIEMVKERNPRVIVSSSVRDILVEKDDGGVRAKKVAQMVREVYDFVFVHSDPEIIKFGETFSQAEAIADQLVYTGFVSETGGRPFSTSPRKPQVLVSQGGGIVGGELMLSAAKAAELFPNLHFRIVLGPNCPSSVKTDLGFAEGAHNVSIENFLPAFEEELGASVLSISLAGYNTVMNLLSTRTPALVLPYNANHEQTLRATKLEERGLLKVLDKNDLEPGRLSDLIKERLETPLPHFSTNLNGARETSLHLSALLSALLSERS